MTDDGDRIDLEEYSSEQYAAFFTDLTAHALAGEYESIADHVQDVIPTPQNVGALLFGMCQGMGVISEIIHPEHDDHDPHVQLQFGTIDDPVDALVAEAGGFPGADAVTAREPESVPLPVRWAAQLTSAAIGRDDATVTALVHTILGSYVAQIEADFPPERVDALQSVAALIQCMVGFAQSVRDQVDEAHARLMG